MIVFLIGFMGSGKSTIGKELARRLGYEFIDTDKRIVEKAGMSINEIFRKKGEKVFREMETDELKELLKLDKIVVSTGGGLPCHSGNMELMNRHGETVYLRADADTLFRRLSSRKQKRPLIRELSDEELSDFIVRKLGERDRYYLLARHVVEGAREDVGQIINRLSF